MYVWREAHALALAIYQATSKFPREELYGITSQIRRAAVSIELNIAEGSKRSTTQDYCRFLDMSQGSTEETKCLLLLARDLQYIDLPTFDQFWEKSCKVGYLLHRLIRSLRFS